MYPPATSFISVTVSLARFAEGNNWFGIYPYWYFGSTPFNYLTGPVVPAILVVLVKILPNFSLFDLSYFILITSHFALSLGWGLLGWNLSKKKTIGILVFLISLVLPWKIVSSLALSEVSAVVASSLTPWVLLAFRVQAFGSEAQVFDSEVVQTRGARRGSGTSDRTVQSQKFFKLITNPYTLVPILLFTILLLVNVIASIPAIIGLIVLAVTTYKKWEEGIRKVVIVVLVGWALTLWWYEPNFWLTIFKAPSFGGKSAVSVFLWLFSLLRGLVPVILAVAVVWWGFSKKDKFLRFSLSWFAIFLILTVLRFLSNPDFWLDWTSWMGEVEVGGVLLLGYFLARSSNASVLRSDVRRTSDTLALRARLGLTRSKASSPRNESSGGVYPERESKGHVFGYFKTAIQRLSMFGIWSLVIVVLLIGGWFVAWQQRDFWLPRKSIEETAEYRIASFLNENVKSDETVFLSGTTAFWLDSFYDIKQVRGGADQSSLHPAWREAAWELRQGSSTQKAEIWLKDLGINYVVVHTNKSLEFYHDFKNTGKFERSSILRKFYDERGDVIYKVEDN